MNDNTLDLYCLECGYNLRGLSGDPRRCPECGYLNPLGDLEIPAPRIRAELRRMETAPAIAAAALLALVSVAAIEIFLALHDAGGEVHACSLFIGLLSLLVWLSAMSSFRSSCGARCGWAWAFIWYHVWVVVVAAPVAAWIIFVPRYLQTRHTRLLLDIPFSFFLLPIMFGVPLLLIVLGGRWAHRSVRRLLDPLQREIAIELARERLKADLRTQR
jgi:hypothetical protein